MTMENPFASDTSDGAQPVATAGGLPQFLNSAFAPLAGLLVEQTLPAGAMLIEQEKTDDSLYIIQSGRLRITSRFNDVDEVLAECGPGEVVGEMAFLTGRARSAHVTALETTRVLRLLRSSYNELEHRFPGVAADIARLLSERLKRSQLGLELHRSRLFGALEPAALRDLESHLELMTLQGGETLFEQGEEGDSMYLVINGRLRIVCRRDDGGEQVVAEAGRGEVIGEMAILGEGHRAATAYAVRDTNLARLSRDGFQRHSANFPNGLGPFLTRTLVARLQQRIATPARRASMVNTIAVVAASPGVDLGDFCARLSTALSRFGHSVHLNAERFDQLVGIRGGSSLGAAAGLNSLIVERLAVVEAENPYVVYQADASASAWSKRCVHQADHIVLLAHGSTDGRPADPEHVLREILPEGRRSAVSLVLIQEDNIPLPTGTAEWLTSPRIGRHYHLRRDRTGDYDRIARVLIGQAVALVLGGGFARGLGHAGVVRALGELEIPVDFVGGTSMGAIIGVQVAMGWTGDEIVTRMGKSILECFKGDFTIPIVSFLRGSQLARVILGYWSGKDINMEDLWVPFFTVSSNLTRACMQVSTRGSVLKSMLSSSRVPGMYPPVVWNGDLLVDGGFVNNVPIDVMKDFANGGRIIAVDVSPESDPAMTADYGMGVSGWSLLWGRLNPFAKQKVAVPGLASVLMRAIVLGDTSKKHAALADLYLTPPLEQFKIGDFRRGDEVAAAAYRYALPVLAEWKAAHLTPTPAPAG